MEIIFVPSQSMTVQGKRDTVYKMYGKNWFIRPLGGGNGNWLVTRPSDVLVNGVSYRAFILEFYEKTRLTELLFERFRNDVDNGIISL
ncbi:MAG: hypothetical protein IKH75_12090 [Ruminococcus sp.]|nr:hypothetical protein [Ruminococcus sp.]